MKRTIPSKAISTVATAAGAAMLLAAPAAHASTATIQSGNRIVVSSAGNEKNQVGIFRNAGLGVYGVTDPAGIDASGACDQVSPVTVTCPAAGIGSVRVTTAAGNDSISLDPATWLTTVEGDLDGGAGDDRLSAAGGADSVRGNSGRDILDGGPGADDLLGGSGVDTVWYGARTTPVIVTVGSGNDNDGNELDLSGNDRDTVRGEIESVLGGSGADILIGDGSDEILFGGEGNDAVFGNRGGDTLLGFTGDDFLSGDEGGDILRGSDGSDRLLGGNESDRLSGGPGDDLLRGGFGADGLKGKGGADILQAKDGTRDLKLNCGPGGGKRERAKRDKRLDPRLKSC